MPVFGAGLQLLPAGRIDANHLDYRCLNWGTTDSALFSTRPFTAERA